MASLRVSISYEREFTRLMGTLEVIVRSLRLTVDYMQLAVSFCFGMLNVKFQPIWESTTRLLVTAMNNSVLKKGSIPK